MADDLTVEEVRNKQMTKDLGINITYLEGVYTECV